MSIIEYNCVCWVIIDVNEAWLAGVGRVIIQHVFSEQNLYHSIQFFRTDCLSFLSFLEISSIIPYMTR